MAKGSLKQIDLLRKRREADSIEPYFLDTKKYIKKGIFSGLTLIALALILGIPFIFRIKFLESEKDKIKIFSDEYDLLQKKLNKESKESNKIILEVRKRTGYIGEIKVDSGFLETKNYYKNLCNFMSRTGKNDILIIQGSLQFISILSSYLSSCKKILYIHDSFINGIFKFILKKILTKNMKVIFVSKKV